MPGRIKDRTILVIYAAMGLLGIAYGTSISVLAVHLDANGIPKLAMGGLAAAFAIGIVALSIPAGWLVERLGTRATLAGALSGYAVCVGSFPFLNTLTGLSVARFFDGAFSAIVWVSAETALLSRSGKSQKGLVMSLYAIALSLGYVIGPLVAAYATRVRGTGSAFVIASVLATFAVVVVLLGLRGSDPETMPDTLPDVVETPGMSEIRKQDGIRESRPSALDVLWRTKTSCFATFSYGYFQSSVVLFLPLYLIESKHIPKDRTILVTAFFALGMLLMSTWAGRLGDRHGHLRVMRILGSVGGAMVASFVLLPSFVLMCCAVFVAGATLASISPVSLALQGVVTPASELGRANAFYNTAFAVGMLLGPPSSGLVFTRYGGASMLLHLAALWAVFVVLTVIYATDDPRHAIGQEVPTVPSPASDA